MATSTAVAYSDAPSTRTLCLDRARRCAARARLERRLDSGSVLNAMRCEGCPLQDETLSLLLRLLPVALKRRVVFHRPGVSETTFDEDWLLQLIETIRRGDEDSVIFALASRVDPKMRSTIRSLAEKCVARFDSTDLELF